MDPDKEDPDKDHGRDHPSGKNACVVLCFVCLFCLALQHSRHLCILLLCHVMLLLNNVIVFSI